MAAKGNFDRICVIVIAVCLVITALFMNGAALGIQTVSYNASGYEQRLFDTSKVHTIDIIMSDWDGFIESCENEEYSVCSLVIDGERFSNVGIRAKGNTSLSSVSSLDSERYSFKLEFDHYDDTLSYYGLDKLCLNNIIQDNTYMKDYLTYQMMAQFGVATSLCSYAYITVNGEDFGLYLAVEAVEDSFLTRNYANEDGELYKPDSMSMGGGRGNGKEFSMSDWESEQEEKASSEAADSSSDIPTVPDQSDRGDMGGFGGKGNMQIPGTSGEGFSFDNLPGFSTDGEGFSFDNIPGFSTDGEGFSFDNLPGFSFGDKGGNGMGVNGSSDVTLIYSDDDYDSYSNIFDSAKTDITNADKDRLIASLKSLNENTDIESVVDVESVIRYFVVHNFVLNFDSYTGSMIHNYYLYEQDGQLSMIPWDYNLAFGGFMSASDATALVNYPIDDPVSGGTVESRPMIAWIFADESYTEQYHTLFAAFLDEVDILSIIEQAKEQIAPYVEKDPTAFCTYEEFVTGVDTLYTFCDLRIQSIEGQLSGSIGSTDEAQKENTNRIDASGLNVSDMGSMGNMGGGGKDIPTNMTPGDFSSNSDFWKDRDSMTSGQPSWEQNMPSDPNASSDPTEDTTSASEIQGLRAGSTATITLTGMQGRGDFNTMQQGGDIPSLPNGETPSMPNGETPSMPNGETPSMPNGETPSMPNGETPSMPNGETPSMPNGETPSMPEDETSSVSSRENSGDKQPMVQGSNQQQGGLENVLLVVISVLVLVFGIVLAACYRRRKE